MTSINKIITKYPIYDTVQIISNSELSHIKTTTSQLKINDLYNLLITSQPKPEYLIAIPLDSNSKFGDVLIFNNGIITLVLTQDSFTRIPNLKSKYGSNKIKQSKDEKNRIRLKLNQFESIPELKFIIDKLFNNVDIKIYYNELINENIGIFSNEKNFTKLPNNLNHLDLDNDEFYELITLCCNFENIIHDNDAFTCLNIDGELEIKTRYTLKHISSQKLKDLDWNILSLHNDNHHILLYKSNPNDITVFEVDRK